jgi:Fic family protein
VASSRGGSGRLAHGGLRQLVIEHLTAHPGEAFTATRIGRVLDRSSGAVANALVTLTKQGRAEQVTERPRTYRAALPDQAA